MLSKYNDLLLRLCYPNNLFAYDFGNYKEKDFTFLLPSNLKTALGWHTCSGSQKTNDIETFFKKIIAKDLESMLL